MLTRNYDRGTNRDGPVSGSVFTLNAQVGASVAGTAVAAAAVHHVVVPVPAGMTITITDVKSYQGVVATAAGTLRVGTTAGGQEIVADSTLAVNASAAVTTHTVVGGSVAATGFIYVQVTGGAGATIAAPVGVSITGFVSAAPTSVGPRTVSGTGF